MVWSRCRFEKETVFRSVLSEPFAQVLHDTCIVLTGKGGLVGYKSYLKLARLGTTF